MWAWGGTGRRMIDNVPSENRSQHHQADQTHPSRTGDHTKNLLLGWKGARVQMRVGKHHRHPVLRLSHEEVTLLPSKETLLASFP
jgi:hypothetical protein